MKISPLQIQDLDTMQDLSSEDITRIQGGLLLAPSTPATEAILKGRFGRRYSCHSQPVRFVPTANPDILRIVPFCPVIL